MYSRCVTTRKNICLTLAKKYELKFAFQLLKGTNFVNNFTFNKKYLIESNFRNLIEDNLQYYVLSGTIEFYSRFYFKDVDFRRGYYLLVNNEKILFYLIHEILTVEDKQVFFFFCQHLLDIKYDGHILAYEVNPNNLGSFELISTDQIVTFKNWW